MMIKKLLKFTKNVLFSNNSEMPLWTLDEIEEAVNGAWLSKTKDDQLTISGVCYYLKQTKPGDLAITTNPKKWGKKYPDTTQQLNEFFSAGAKFVITDKKPKNLPKDKAVYLVKDTRLALNELAEAARSRFKGKVICITGSVGKTSTKEALNHVLKKQAPTNASNRNFNHSPGVPLSIAQTHRDYSYGVYEFCIDLPGRTLPKAKISRPNIALVTEIEPDHLMYYPTLEEIADNKALLFDGLEPGGIVILNRDANLFERLQIAAVDKGAAQIITYGASTGADIRLIDCQLTPDYSKVKAIVENKEINYKISIPGRHMVMNSLAVLATVHAAGGDYIRAAKDLATLPLLEHRNQRKTVHMKKGSIQIIDDTFSANPASMRAAFEYLNLIKPKSGGRRIVVLSDIKELGDQSEEIHAALAAPIMEAGIDKVFTLGTDMRALFNSLPIKHRGAHAESSKELVKDLLGIIKPNDAVLVKGSLRSQKDMQLILHSLYSLEGKDVPKVEMKKPSVSKFDYKPIILQPKNPAQPAKIVFVGDTSFGENYQVRIKELNGDNILEKYGYDHSLKRMKRILCEADLSIANLETPVTNVKISPFKGKKSYIHWTDIEKSPESLLKHNINTVSLANNHSFDYGEKGFVQTLDVLEKNSIDYFGVGRNEEHASLPIIRKIKTGNHEFKFSVIANFQLLKIHEEEYKSYAKGDRGGINPLNIDKVKLTIERIKNIDPDTLVILFPHWGNNYQWKSNVQAQLATDLLKAGADLIIGHGAHMIQEIEKVNNKWIVYSIGNFMFNSPGRYKKLKAPPYSLVARLIAIPRQTKLTVMLRLYPIVTNNLITNYQPRFVSQKEFNEVCQLLAEKNTSQETLIHSLSRNADQYGYYLELPIR